MGSPQGWIPENLPIVPNSLLGQRARIQHEVGLAPVRAAWWWIDRWRKSTAYTDMTLEEQGAYRNLLDEAHLRGGYLPNDERILAKACGDAHAWKRVRKTVLARFAKTSRGLHNETLNSVMKESVRRAKKQADYRARLDAINGNGGGNSAGN